ncbi:MAG: ornithine carbamoyltransferase [Ardenticatenia bacterium]|jgi:ornithine carbamoyltransferase|nr:MAG: ornithine carbamoyltransferase [Ardenticatenia bacterium]
MKHLISIADLSSEELWHILNRARQLKDEWRSGGNRPILKGKVMGMIFQKPSLRTRISFDVAMLQLGGQALYISPDEIRLGERESVPDVARVLSRYVDVIMARVFSHQHIVDLATYSRVPVINGLSDYSHPCQGIADMFTIWEKLGYLKGVKLTYVGDANNVAVSLLFAATKLGMDFTIAHPPGYGLPAEVLRRAEEFARGSGSRITVTHDPVAAVRGAQVVYTDVWTSMGQEAEKAEREAVFPPYQVNIALLSHARPDAIVMHCLPAHRGQEITDEVADSSHSALFDQAENRLHAQKGILAFLMVDQVA